jgi:hypothetical protein
MIEGLPDTPEQFAPYALDDPEILARLFGLEVDD